MPTKTRIASYYPDVRIVGRNDGGPLYHTHDLRLLFGAENVKHILPLNETINKHGNFDLHYWVDFGEDALQLGHDVVCPKPNVYITSDTHLGYDYRLKKAREFDWVFCNQHKAQQDFIRDGIPADRCFWLPHAYDPMAYGPGVFNKKTNQWMDAVVEKKYDVCFVGNLNDRNRVAHLDRLFKEFPNFHWCCARFHEAAEVFNKSKIVFNVSSRGELNMRMFEALGSRSFLLSDRLPEGENVFQDGVHFAGYNGLDEMIDKARYYLAHDDEREQIAEAGYREAITKHTYLHRVRTVLDTIGFPYDKDLLGYWLSEMSLGRDVRGQKPPCVPVGA